MNPEAFTEADFILIVMTVIQPDGTPSEFPEVPPVQPEQTQGNANDVISDLSLHVRLKKNLAVNKNLFDLEESGLRPNQSRAITALKEKLDEDNWDLRGYFVQPTGAGKTVLFGMITKLLDVKTIIFVPKMNLLKQTKKELIETCGFDEDDIGIIGGGTREIGKKITISTYQSHVSLIGGNKDYAHHFKNVQLIHCDEAHRALGEKTSESLQFGDENLTEEEERDEMTALDSLENQVSKSVLMLGYTATPKLSEKHIKEVFGNCMIAREGYADLIHSGALVPYKIFHTKGYLPPGEISPEVEIEVLERNQIYQKLLQKYVDTSAKLKKKFKGAAFCANINECNKFIEMAERDFGLKCSRVTSIDEKDELEKAETKLLNGEIDLIVTVDKLTEGWNFRPLDAVILARATSSPARLLQGAGRSSRSFPGKEFAHLFETDWKAVAKNEYLSATNEEGQIISGDNSTPGDSSGETSQKKLRNRINILEALLENGESSEDLAEICLDADGHTLDYKLADRYERAPEGWCTNWSLVIELNVSQATPERIAERHRTAHPEWFKMCIDPQNRLNEFYAPELADVIRNDIKQRPQKPPEGWFSKTELAHLLEIDVRTMNKIIEKIRSDHPEWFGYYLDPSNHKIEYLSPELADHALTVLTERGVVAPEGWMTAGVLKKVLGCSIEFIIDLSDKEREAHPEWFKTYINSIKRPSEHLSPELVKIISDEFIKKPVGAPEGWITNKALADAMGVSEEKVKKLAEAEEKAHPEWFKTYISHKKARIHYAPELVQIIKSSQASLPEPAPEGWMTSGFLFKKFGLTNDSTLSKRLMTKALEMHPEYAKNYLDKGKRPMMHYDPRIEEVITALMKEHGERAPVGWYTNKALSNELGFSENVTAAMADGERAAHPEWFKIYLNSKNNKLEHFAPELVTLIRERIAAKGEKVPDGWVTNKSIAVELNVDESTTKAIALKAKKTHPDWTKMYLSQTNHQLEHYHPDLAQFIRDAIKSRPVEKAPDGWLTNRTIADEIGQTFYTVKKIAEAERSAHPEWFKMYLGSNNQTFEYYAPELVTLIREKAAQK